jgi:hypothetical protein
MRAEAGAGSTAAAVARQNNHFELAEYLDAQEVGTRVCKV